MRIKKILKIMLRKIALLQWSVSHMDIETAKTILKSFWPDPSTTCVAKNAIDLQYDLQIIVPAYNVEKFVAQCLESALNQKTNYSYLVTVINDGSTDQTLEIIRLYQKKERLSMQPPEKIFYFVVVFHSGRPQKRSPCGSVAHAFHSRYISVLLRFA